MTRLSGAILRIDGVLKMAITVMCVALATLVPLLALASVASRYVPFFRAVWSPELTEAATLSLVMLGAALAAYNSAHVRITLMESFRIGWPKRVGDYISAVSMGLLGFGMVALGLQLVQSVAGQVTPILLVPIAIPYSSTVLSGFAITLHSLSFLLTAKKSAVQDSGARGKII